LSERVQSFVDELPKRLAGGDTAEVIRSATTRGLAYFVAFILTLFLVLHGPRMVRGGIGLIDPVERREYVHGVLARAYTRSWGYLLGTLGISLLTGAYAYAWCRLADLPGATVLAMTVALAAVVPNVGVMIGALPVLLLTAGLDPNSGWTLSLAVMFAFWQVLDVYVLRRHLNRRSITIGPVVTVLVVMLARPLWHRWCRGRPRVGGVPRGGGGRARAHRRARGRLQRDPWLTWSRRRDLRGGPLR
jgi:predicted PurR-regulated permease PerM